MPGGAWSSFPYPPCAVCHISGANSDNFLSLLRDYREGILVSIGCFAKIFTYFLKKLVVLA